MGKAAISIDKKTARLRRAKHSRTKIKELGALRLSVHRTPRHIYAQIIAPSGSEVRVCASTLEAVVKGGIKSTGNIEAATVVGKTLAERAKAAGVTRVAFDRSGFQYHGRVKALAEAARAHGLEF